MDITVLNKKVSIKILVSKMGENKHKSFSIAMNKLSQSSPSECSIVLILSIAIAEVPQTTSPLCTED
jgi:hypothetical protein